jgi:hypothetical protein
MSKEESIEGFIEEYTIELKEKLESCARLHERWADQGDIVEYCESSTKNINTILERLHGIKYQAEEMIEKAKREATAKILKMLPKKRRHIEQYYPEIRYNDGWNECIDDIKELLTKTL